MIGETVGRRFAFKVDPRLPREVRCGDPPATGEGNGQGSVALLAERLTYIDSAPYDTKMPSSCRGVSPQAEIDKKTPCSERLGWCFAQFAKGKDRYDW